MVDSDLKTVCFVSGIFVILFNFLLFFFGGKTIKISLYRIIFTIIVPYRTSLKNYPFRVLEGEQCFRESQSTVCLCNAQLCNNFLPAAVEQVVPEGNLGQVLVLMLLLLIVLAVLAGALYTLCRGLRRRRGQRLDTSCSAHRLTFHLANSPPPAAELTTYRYFAVSERPQHGGGQLPLPNHSEKEEKSQKSDGKNTNNQMHNSPSENLRPEATVPILCYASHYI